MKTESLLDKAKARVRLRTRSLVDESELLELALAVARGEVGYTQSAAALGTNPGTGVYSKMFTRLSRAVQSGEISITVNGKKGTK